MLSVALLDLPRLELAVAGDVVPPRAWAELAQSLPLVDEARRVLDESLRVAQQRERQAYEQGVESGRRMFAAAIVALDQQRAEERRRQAESLVPLAVAVVRKLAPRLGAGALVPELAASAVAAAQAAHWMVVRVHPSLAEAVAAQLGGPRGGAPVTLRVEGDPSLGEFDCEVDTDLGQALGSFEVQLQAIESALRATAP